MAEPILPPLKPVPIKDRISVLFGEKGNLDVLDGAFVVVDKNGVRGREMYELLARKYHVESTG